MIKNLSLVLSALIFVGCSTTSENLQHKEKKNKVDTLIVDKKIKEVITDINSTSIIKTEPKLDLKDNSKLSESISEKKVIKKFSFNGIWISSKTSNFLQRKLELRQINESYAKGELIFSYLNISDVETVNDKFNIEVFLNDFDIQGFIRDSKTSKIEKIRILRDSENEFRIITKKNTIFFESNSMMFKKKSLPENKNKILELKKVTNYFKRKNNQILDSKNKLLWQDTNSAKYLKTNYNNAKFYCSSLGEKWRLPSREELKGIYSLVDNSIDKEFKNSLNTGYWSNEESIDDRLKAWSFDYKSGNEKIVSKDKKLNIRCCKENKTTVNKVIK